MYAKTCLQQLKTSSFKSYNLGVSLASLRFYAARKIYRDPYKVLNLRRGASKEEIKTAYLNLSKKLHPDVNTTDPKAKQKFVEVNEAYKELSGTDGRGSMRTSFYNTWNMAEDRYNYAPNGVYSMSWNAFLAEKRKSEDPFWIDYFRRNDSKDRYILNQEEKDRIKREFYEWNSHFYENYRQRRAQKEWKTKKFTSSFVVFVLGTFLFFQLLLVAFFEFKKRWEAQRLVKSGGFDEYKKKVEEEIIHGTYQKHGVMRKKQIQRYSLQDELKEYSYYQQSLKENGR